MCSGLDMFCPKCGSILKSKSDKDRKELFCSCGYSRKNSEEILIKEEIEQDTKEIFVHEQFNPLANYEHECKKCGFDKAYIVQKELAKCETWARCEPNRTEVVCGKCGFRERLE